MKKDKSKKYNKDNDDQGMTVEQLADLYNTTVGEIWQEIRQNSGNYMGMWYDPGDGKLHRK